MTLPRNVVIVEDEMIAQRYLKDILANLGIAHVEAFTNMQDTLTWLKHSECDLLLADINLKGSMDGIQMAREILKRYDLPIIFITAYSDNNTLDDALSTSPYGYLVKPFSQSDIELQIRVGYQKFLHHKTQKDYRKEEEKENLNIIQINKNLFFSLKNHRIYKEGKPIYLTHKQNELVSVLCKNINNIVSYEQLEFILWENESHADSALRTLIYSIRNTLPELQIISHSKLGYSIRSA